MKSTKISTTQYALLFALAAMMLASLSLSAQTQLTPFQIATEVMTFQQSVVLRSLGSKFGPDAQSLLTYSTQVDPAGQNFNFSLNAGSTYLGQPITLTTSGTLANGAWTVSSSGTYLGLPWSIDSTYVSPTAAPVMANDLSGPICSGCTGLLYSGYAHYTGVLNPSGFGCGGGCYESCINRISTFSGDSETCTWYYPGGTPYQGPTYITSSDFFVSGSVEAHSSGWSLLPPSGFNFLTDLTGDSPTNGSLGTSTSLISPLTVSTVSYFSDLGSGANTYQCCDGWEVSGGFTAANQFTAAASGDVSSIDIGIGDSGLDLFNASIWTNNNGIPGTPLAEWDALSSSLSFGQCCGVVTIKEPGLSLTEGQQYFLVLGPGGPDADLWWNKNSQNVIGLDLYSPDGGVSWISNGPGSTLGAFDILSQPEGIVIEANQFQVAASGGVSQIDVAVGLVSGQNAFSIGVYDNNNGVPGTPLDLWDYSSPQNFGGCCALISITGISGLNLTAGQQYFIVVRGQTDNSTTSGEWNQNTTSAIGLDLFSLDSGDTWNSRGQQVIGAFDVLSGGTTLYSNLGTGTTVYQCCNGFPVTGSASGGKSMVKRTK